MSFPQPYRVLSRPTALAIAAALVVGAALLAFGVQRGFDRYAERLAALKAASAPEAALLLGRDLKIFALAELTLLLALALPLLAYGVRALRAQAMPPPGSWIIEGQRTHSGAQAVRAAWVVIVCAGLVTVLAGAVSTVTWRLAATLGG